jgi:hypothetical protein
VSFIKRLFYYLGGVGLGIIILMFFLSGKKTSCDYGPNARTLKFLKSKPLQKSKDAERDITLHNIDSLDIKAALDVGEINFSSSEISNDLPNIYALEINLENKGSFEFRFKIKKDSIEIISIEPFDP